MKYKNLRLMVYQYLKPHFLRLFSIFCLLFLFALLSLIIPLCYKKIIDFYIPNRQFFSILILLFFLAIILLSQRYIGYLEAKLSSWLKRDIFIKLKMDIYNRIQKLPLNYYTNGMSGNIVSNFIFDVENTEVFFNNTALKIIRDLLFILVLFPFLFFIDVEMATLGLFLIPVSFLIYKIYSSKLTMLGQKLSKNIEEYSGNLQENISQIKVIKTYNLHDLKKNEMAKKIRKIEDKKQDIQIKSAQYAMLQVITLIGINFITWGVGSYKVLRGDLTLGALIAMTSYFHLAIQPFSRSYINILNFPRSTASLNRLAELLSLEVETTKEDGIIPPKSRWDRLRLENITFEYNRGAPILTNINIEFKENSCMLIEGPSGSGKTTLFHLLLRFYTPQSGKIYLNERPIEEYNLTAYRKLFSVVYQDPILFNTSIVNNITLFNNNIKIEKLETVIRMTGLDSLREQLVNGLETIVGEWGIKLSGGQKQRICLARALLVDSPFIILDEATANLDIESELEIISALKNMIGVKTIIIISHRFPKHLLQPDSVYELKMTAKDGK